MRGDERVTGGDSTVTALFVYFQSVITEGEDDDPDTSNLDGLPVLIFKYNIQNPVNDDDASDGQVIEYTETYTFIDMSEIMDFHVASTAEVTAMLNEVFPEIA